MDLMARRFAMMGQSAISEFVPIYSLSNYQVGRTALDTGILLYKSGGSGYSFVLETDFTSFSANNGPFMPGIGYYFGQWYVQANPTLGYDGSTRTILSTRNNDKGWLRNVAYSLNADAMTITAFWNDAAANTISISALITSTDTCKINLENRPDLMGVIVKRFEIYDFPMTEAQMRKLLE